MQGENAKKVCGFDENDMKTYSCRRGFNATAEFCLSFINEIRPGAYLKIIHYRCVKPGPTCPKNHRNQGFLRCPDVWGSYSYNCDS